MKNNVDRVSEQKSTVINSKLNVDTLVSNREVSFSGKPIGMQVKIARDISLINVPLQVVAHKNSVTGKPDITSITD